MTTTVSGLLALLLHAPMMAGAAVLLAGLAAWAPARMAGYAGPPPFQVWHDWRRLLRKQPVRPEGASAAYAAALLVGLAATAAAALLVPSFSLGMLTAPSADLLLVAGLLVVARAAMLLAAMDAGTAPGALFALAGLRAGLLAEPALAAAALVVALLTGGTNLPGAVAALREAPAALPLLLTLAGLAAVAAAEPGPGAAPFSGWHQAAMEAAAALRRVVWLSVLAALLLPATLALPGFDAAAWLLSALAWAAKVAALAALCALLGAASPPGLPRAGMLLILVGLLSLLTGGDLT